MDVLFSSIPLWCLFFYSSPSKFPLCLFNTRAKQFHTPTAFHFSMAQDLNTTLEGILHTYLDAVKGGESGLQLLLDKLGPLFSAEDLAIYSADGVEAFMSVGFLTRFVILVLQASS